MDQRDGFLSGMTGAVAALLAMAGAALAEAPASADRAAGPVAAIAASAGTPARDADLLYTELAELTQVGPLLQIVATEGARHGLGLEESLFPGRGGAEWAGLVARIQSPERLKQILDDAFREAMREADLAAVHGFFSSDLGRRVAAREVASRRSMLDADAERDAMRASAGGGAEPIDASIDTLIDELDLVANNVSGGLNANYAFYRGLGDGGALRKRMTETEMLAMVWGQEPDIRRATSRWLRAHLTLAYGVLSDDEMDRYVGFMSSPEGRRYSAAMFEGFGVVFERTSYELGRAAADFMARQDI